ncbi:MAG: RluA family pseudouridine synthase [Firmicutes bacterium]|nr:RluA family pseudouridine synthase [Bacillota bacterium]MCL1953602.1 RluA family pseudouridine synthase [Bacillota bacterium]
MKHNLINKKDQMLLIDFVCTALDIDARLFSRLLDKKEIRVNTVISSQNLPLRAGDMVSVFLPQKFVERQDKPLEVVFVNEHILIFNKPQGIAVEDYQKLVQKQYPKSVLAHRLDRNTGGILVFGANVQCGEALLQAFKQHKVIKTYYARVHGRWQVNQSFRAWIFKDAKLSQSRVFDTKRVGCKEIETHFENIKEVVPIVSMGVSTHTANDNTTWIRVMPKTGRTHQIRAHLCHLQHPIVGEGKYSLQQYRQANLDFQKQGIRYQQLFAMSIKFVGLVGELEYLNDRIFEIK